MALAVSGGSDSTALMRLAHAWAQVHHPDLRLSVLSVDHRLRPGAHAESLQVGTWAAQIGLAHHVLTWDDQPKPTSGIQARARAARYSLVAEWCRNHGAGLLLTAHTLDDQAETVLMRLARTSSPDSLAGIRSLGEWDGLPVLRPLLKVRRQALRDYLKELDQPWVEDPSNSDPRFERVRIRQSLAVMGDRGVTAERLAALGEAAVRTARLLERLAQQWLSTWLCEEEAGFCRVPLKPFISLPMALQERILAKIVRHYGGGQNRPEPEELRRLASWATGEGPVRCTLGGALLGRRQGGFWVTREVSRIRPEPVKVPDCGRTLWDGRFVIEAAPGAMISPAGSRKVAIGAGVPVFARRAYPVVEQPPEAEKAPEIGFLRLKRP